MLNQLFYIFFTSTALCISGCLSGCGSTANRATGSAGSGVSISAQLKQRDDVLIGQRFRNLVDFEMPDDAVFVSPNAIRSQTAHTGAGAMRTADGGVEIYLSKLLSGQSRVGEWTLAGVYCRADADGPVTVELASSDNRVLARQVRSVVAGGWVFCGVDLTALPVDSDLSNTTLRLTALSSASIDDVLLVNNRRVLVDSTGAMGWRVEQAGFQTRVNAPGRFAYDVVGDAGLSVVEANAVRVRADRAPDDPQGIVLYADGRLIEGARVRVLSADIDADAVRAADASPGEIIVDEASGRVDRTTPGDANNDGYNERDGTYHVAATASRVSFELTPGGTGVVNPVIHIHGMKSGKITVMVEGVLFDTVARLPDESVLVMLPVTLQRATRVSVKVVP